MGEYQYNWSQQSLDELEEFATNEVLPAWDAEESDTERAYPTAKWLRGQGWSGIRYALREQHERTLAEFFQEVVDVDDVSADDDRRCGVKDETTEAALEAYFGRREERGLLAESTLQSRLSRMRRWVDTYRDIHETDALVPAAADDDDKALERERARRVLDKIAADLSTDRSRFAFVSEIRSVYSWLSDEGHIAFNPLSGVESEYKWERTEPDNQSLTAEDIADLLDAADSEGRELLVVALAGWGLRPSEVAALHVSQFVLEGDDPHIQFDQRKNGPGTVSVLVGRDVVDERINALAMDVDDWSGYLWPSSSSKTGHVHPDTVRRRFVQLAMEADATVEGDRVTPKTARRFWYSSYSTAMARVMEDMERIAEDQGAASGRVVWENYLSEEDRRRRRRQEMKRELGNGFYGN